jgi:hypothetical protein
MAIELPKCDLKVKPRDFRHLGALKQSFELRVYDIWKSGERLILKNRITPESLWMDCGLAAWQTRKTGIRGG